jgi:hypothetical protein
MAMFENLSMVRVRSTFECAKMSNDFKLAINHEHPSNPYHQNIDRNQMLPKIDHEIEPSSANGLTPLHVDRTNIFQALLKHRSNFYQEPSNQGTTITVSCETGTTLSPYHTY